MKDSSRIVHVFVVEGPAGSGKTTFIRNLQPYWLPIDTQEAVNIADLPRPRAYEQDQGVLLSQMKDFRSCLRIAYLGLTRDILVVDRWVLSQQVYGAIRRGSIKVDEMALRHSVMQNYNMLYGALRDLFLRKGADAPAIDYSIHFIILVPSVKVIDELRAKTGKKYPYDARLEGRLYRMTAHILSGMQSTEMDVSKYEIENLAQYDWTRSYQQSILQQFIDQKPGTRQLPLFKGDVNYEPFDEIP